MIVTHLNLSDYRNYAVADVGMAPGANLFVGRNGQGKTNLVEALGYLSTLGSHRVSSDQALIRAGTDAAVIRARLQHNGRELLAEVQIAVAQPVPRSTAARSSRGNSRAISRASSSRPKISALSAATPQRAAGSSTSFSSCTPHGWPAS